jgi:hypothetical protein
VKTIELRDVGPVEHLSIPIPAGGGLVVLQGRNGLGKTHSLAAVSALIGNGAKPASRDGTLGATVEGLGARLTVGRRSTVSGEIEVAHLDGEDPSLLVDPGIKSPEAADAARVCALLRLAGAKVTPDAFAPLVGGEAKLRTICRPSSLEARDGDVTAMAAAIKRDLEAEARKHELVASNLYAKADGMRSTVAGLGIGDAPTSSVDSAEARERHTQAVRAHSGAEARRKQAEQTAKATAAARASLAALGDDGHPATLAAAEEDERACDQVVEQLRAQLAQAVTEQAMASGKVTVQRKAAKQREQLQRTLEATVEAESVDDDTLAELERAVQVAAGEVETWAVRDKSKSLTAEVERLRLEGIEAESEAVIMRAAARGTENVVLQALRDVCGEDMELSGGRLYVHSDRGERELFADLSHGERWRRALDISIAAVGTQGLLVCRQEAYESLDPQNRAELAEYARRRGVVILTAEAADGELRAVVQHASAVVEAE